MGDLGAAKQCSKCREVKPLTLFHRDATRKSGYGPQCKACISQIQKERRSEYNLTRKRWIENNPEAGKLACKKYYDRNPARTCAKQKAWRTALREQTLVAYGCRCACCGETTPEFLAIDHIFNDGTEHRQRSGRRLTGSILYLWLRNNGYPKDRFQLLCHNCNQTKEYYGVCPHQEGKEVPPNLIGIKRGKYY